MGATELSVLLWRERQALELLLASAEERNRSGASGRPAGDPGAPHQAGGGEAGEALGLIRLARDIELAAVAEEWGLGPEAGLLEAAAAAPPGSWGWILESHHQAISELNERLGHAREFPGSTGTQAAPSQDGRLDG